MTATDELRRLLDERGVEYYDMQNRGIWFGISEDGKDHKYEAFEQTDGLIEIDAFDLTPEQAIAATLGRGECHMEQIPECRYDDIECNECGICLWGFFMDKPGEGVCSKPNYCPYCGREVKR